MPAPLSSRDRAILRAIIDAYDADGETSRVEDVVNRFGYTPEQVIAVGIVAEQLGLLQLMETGQQIIRFHRINDRARELAKD